jgi:signal transduction histidine kinase
MGRSTKPDGSGVGVIHIRDLILEMGGKLKYTSSSGGGTTVSVWFPRPRAADPMR